MRIRSLSVLLGLFGFVSPALVSCSLSPQAPASEYLQILESVGIEEPVITEEQHKAAIGRMKKHVIEDIPDAEQSSVACADYEIFDVNGYIRVRCGASDNPGKAFVYALCDTTINYPLGFPDGYVGCVPFTILGGS